MNKNKGKYNILFIVQGEGRGHITQALAAYKILKEAGHDIVCVMVGISKFRDIPDFFYRNLDSLVIHYPSPNLVRDAKDKSIRLWKSFFYNFFKIPFYLRKQSIFHFGFREMNPDIVLNFHELLTGIYIKRFKTEVPVISIAHQYLYKHPEFNYISIDKKKIKPLEQINYWSTWGSQNKLALGFRNFKDVNGLQSFPPLLRKEILQAKPIKGSHFLVYILNPGYADEIVQWHRTNPDVRLYCFWELEEKYEDENLRFFKLDDKKYIELLISCKGLVSTAGFESVCEAMYLEKPVMMVPVKNHYEQYINAQDAMFHGAAMVSKRFDLSKFLEYCQNYQPNKNFIEWVKKAPEMLVKVLDENISPQ